MCLFEVGKTGVNNDQTAIVSHSDLANPWDLSARKFTPEMLRHEIEGLHEIDWDCNSNTNLRSMRCFVVDAILSTHIIRKDVQQTHWR